ncbi:MAG: tyrosine-type recombinase/integrase [bacterium]|nr:tyrosine-type recombinase/integrase [bacterium]
MTQDNAFRMLRRRARQAGLDMPVNNHTFRTTAITPLLENGADLEQAQELAGHADVRTTRLYDRRRHATTQAVVEKIDI